MQPGVSITLAWLFCLRRTIPSAVFFIVQREDTRVALKAASFRVRFNGFPQPFPLIHAGGSAQLIATAATIAVTALAATIVAFSSHR